VARLRALTPRLQHARAPVLEWEP
jgi:hypothetical protein